MAEIWTMGELLVEIMRPGTGTQLYEPGDFRGPYPSGAPAIFIDTAARMGHTAGIIGGVGADDFGKCLRDRLGGDGVVTSHIAVMPGTTGIAFVTYFEDGSRRFLYHMGGSPAVAAKAPNPETLGDAKYFHIMGCSLMPDRAFADEILKTMDALRARGAKISFDPNIRPELMGDKDIHADIGRVMAACEVFLPGMEELLMISGEDTVARAVEKCFQNPVLSIIALKKGSRGCEVFTRQEHLEFGIYPTPKVDPTGAGDSFDAAFLCGLLEGAGLYESARIATAAASLNTAAFGPMEGNISRAEVRRVMDTMREVRK